MPNKQQLQSCMHKRNTFQKYVSSYYYKKASMYTAVLLEWRHSKDYTSTCKAACTY